MDTAGAKLLTYNAVVVFQELRFGAALNELARRLLPNASPLITEIPEQLLAVVYPEKQIQCQFANRRVEVRDSRGVEPGTDPFATVATRAFEAASVASGPQVLAYGYNFDVSLPLKGSDPKSFLKDRFLANPDRLGEAFSGDIDTVGIKASIRARDCVANFDLEPAGNGTQSIRAHVNYHFEGGRLPSDPGALEDEMRNKYADFLAALGRL